MATLKEFIEISKVAGVDQYILVDKNGNIAAGAIENPQNAAGVIFACGQNLYSLGKTRVKQVIFSMKNQKNLFIFPVGSYYLGVIKQTHINNADLADNIANFLNNLHKKK